MEARSAVERTSGKVPLEKTLQNLVSGCTEAKGAERGDGTGAH
jgi:hypothetical protein